MAEVQREVCCGLLTLLWLLIYPPALLSEDEIGREDFLPEYMPAQKRVRDFYSHLYLEANASRKRVVLSGPSRGTAHENRWLLRYWAASSRSRRDLIREDGRCYIIAGFWDIDMVWIAEVDVNTNQVVNYRLSSDKDERWRHTLRSSGYVALIPYCLPLPGWPQLEEVLRDPSVRVKRIWREKALSGNSVRIEIETTHQERPYEYSVWLRPDMNYVVTRVERTTGRACRSWSIKYLTSNEGIPLVSEVYERYDGPDTLEEEESQLISDEAHFEVKAGPYTNDGVFTAASIGVSTFAIWWEWLRYYWRLYAIGHILFYLQLLLVIVLVSWIAYRRWRRRRMAMLRTTLGPA